MGEIDQKQEQDSVIPDLDEGWWNSVLADEESLVAEQREINCRPCQNKITNEVDWECIKRVFANDEVVLLEVVGFNRGGLLVQRAGIEGFVPVSHLVDLSLDTDEEARQINLADYVGRSLYLKVIECEPDNDRVVLSERAAQAGEGKRKELFESLKPGVVACGVVTNLTEFGAFVDLGGVEGLIHVSELSWGRVENPANLLRVGQGIKVIVLQVNESNSRIALSLKRLTPNPWDQLLITYKPGDVVKAELTSIMNFGVFARLPEGIEGLIHISTLPNDQRKGEISQYYQPGQQVLVRILHLDAERRRLGLGLVKE